MISVIVILSLLGLSLGSFLNVCIYRIPRGLSVLHLASFCPGCRRQLRWYELIPIISFVASVGKCRRCSQPISLRYPLIECSSSLLVVAPFLLYGASAKLILIVTFLLLMLLIAIIDWQHLIIPNSVILAGLALGVLLHALYNRAELVSHLFSALSALVALLAFRFLGNWLFKRETMGMGDVKLAALVGLFLGLQDFFVSLWFAAVLGSGFGLTLKSTLRNPKSEITPALGSSTPLPFGSFLAMSSSLVLIFQERVHLLLQSWFSLSS